MHKFNIFVSMNKKRRVYFALFCILTVLWAGVIFNFSATVGEDSVKQSNGLIKNVFGIFFSDENDGETSKTEQTANVVKEPPKEQKKEENKENIKEEVKQEAEDVPIRPDANVGIAEPPKAEQQNPVSENKDIKTEKTVKKTNYVLKENISIISESDQKKEDRIKTAIKNNENIPMFTALNNIIRKFAHIGSYVFLAFLAYCAIASVRSFPDNNAAAAWVSVVLCVIFACTDEYHQSFVYGRSGRLSDVIVDSFGIFAGTLIAYWAAQGLSKIKKRK